MLKYIQTKDIKYEGKLFRGRKIIGTEETLKIIYPLIDKAIFTWGWRSKKEQEEMVKKGVSKTLDSNHRRGVAYDIWNWKECEKEMRKLGFINDLSWDPGHFPFGGENKARKNYKIIDELPKKLEEYKKEIVKKVAEEKKEIIDGTKIEHYNIPPQIKVPDHIAEPNEMVVDNSNPLLKIFGMIGKFIDLIKK